MHGMVKYAIIGDYPPEHQDESFRADVKILKIGESSLETVQESLKEFEDKGYQYLQIWEYRAL